MMLQSNSLPPQSPGWLMHGELRSLFNKEYIDEYIKLTGMNEASLERWMIPTLAVRVDEMQGEYRQEIVDKLQIRLKEEKTSY